MVSVFLSHSSKDKPFVRDLADALEAGDDVKVWLDEREIDYGANIVLKIGEGLDADVVLLILSPDSVDSKWVKEEWTDAYWEHVNTQTTKLAGVLYRDCTIPRLLRNNKYFDLRTNQTEGFRQIKTWLLGLRQPVAPLVHLPQRSPLFIGRQPEIEDLQRRLKDPGSITYISGLAGRGKTTLALEFAHRYQRNYESVHWIPCQGRTITQMAGELAWQLGLKLEGELDTTLHELNGHCARKHCLLILDNVEDDAPSRLIPGGLTSVLVTTRLNTLHFLRQHQPLQLPLFTEEQCFELFRTEIGQEEVDRHADDARALFQRLGFLPIGIAVAASLIREDVHYTIAGMAKDLPADAFALLKEAVEAVSEKAQTLLAAMAVCAPEGFRLGLAAEIAELDEATSLDALQELRSRSLVEELDRSKRRYRLHALVREASAPNELFRQRHAESVHTEFNDWSTLWRQCEEDMADWQVALAWLLSQSTDDNAWSIVNALAYAGFALTYRLGRLPEAHEICERMAREASARQEKGALYAWYGNQALILQDWGRLDDAMALYRKVEAICMELGDQDALQTCYGNQALILKDWGRLDEALALLKKQEAICLELGNQDSLQRSYGNQATILQGWGRLDDAMALLKKQEAICLELGNQDGLQLSYTNQALILEGWGRLDNAMALLKKQEAICLELGKQDGLGASYENQALILQDWGRLDEAMALHKKGEAIFSKLSNQDGLQLSFGNQALILKDWGRLDEAMALQKKKETICLELGNQNGLQVSFGNQAIILKDWGRLDEAMALHKKEEAICLELRNQESLQRSFGNQAIILEEWGRLDEAMALHKKEEAICLELRNTLGLAGCYFNWGQLAGKLGDSKTEREKLGQALALYTELKMPREVKIAQDALDEAIDSSQPN
jgi:tetratricopeptide (TPR) repeat protein